MSVCVSVCGVCVCVCVVCVCVCGVCVRECVCVCCTHCLCVGIICIKVERHRTEDAELRGNLLHAPHPALLL